MWSTSRCPTSATISSRIASSSRPNASACSPVSVAVVVMCFLSSKPELEIGERARDAQLDLLVALARHGAGDEVAHRAGAFGRRAALADAHAAAVLGPLAGALELVEERGALAHGAVPA